MRLVAITTVKNECDIIEVFVRHTATTCDTHLIVDNGSTDNTREVLAELEAEGFDLRVTDDRSAGNRQSERMTRLMRMAVDDFAADWVIPLDADEFVDVDPLGDLRNELKKAPTPVYVPWRSYVPTNSDDPGELNPVIRIRNRLVAEAYPWKKVLAPRRVAASAVLSMGSHDLVGRDGGTNESPVLQNVALCHFPIRSPEQYAAKVAVANLQWIALGNRGTLGIHSKAPYERLMADWSHFAHTYTEDARRYAIPPEIEFDPEIVLDPFPYRGGDLRYTTQARSSEPWATILEYALSLAEEYPAAREAALAEREALERDLVQTREQALAAQGSWESRVKVLSEETRQLTDRLNAAERDNAGLRDHTEALVSSRSWRVTRPLRAGGRLLRRIRHH